MILDGNILVGSNKRFGQRSHSAHADDRRESKNYNSRSAQSQVAQGKFQRILTGIFSYNV